MHITQHTDYALRVLIHLAANAHRLATIQEISDCFDISRSHLMKVVNQLVRLGFVEGVRGKGGGLRLARAPVDIGIGDVIRQMEAGFALVECQGEDSRCLLTRDCRLKGVLDRALAAFLAELDRSTLADLIGPAERKALQLLHRRAPDSPSLQPVGAPSDQ
ncbi:RrF2 family transcriptional regulator [Methyloversatilis thermotolerans]|uniref:RrF2 family transcriptional regulator n=1 Tax=Methyloversatilis thermotolerans TaxID=1346290 RepID=UPI00037C6991|nr:Rrf2 family transcriptional regulator [Methyloversatilis thermotolerans]